MALKLRPNCKKQKICFGVYPLFNFDRFPHKNDKLLKKWITAYSYGTRELVPFKNCRALQKAFLPQWFFSELVFVSKLKKNVFKKRCCPKDFSETPAQKKKELLRNESSGFFLCWRTWYFGFVFQLRGRVCWQGCYYKSACKDTNICMRKIKKCYEEKIKTLQRNSVFGKRKQCVV